MDTVVLRNAKNTNTDGLPGQNIGVAKGATYDHVVLYPTQPMKKFFRSRNPEDLAPQSLAKLYVAVTRARHSVRVVI